MTLLHTDVEPHKIRKVILREIQFNQRIEPEIELFQERKLPKTEVDYLDSALPYIASELLIISRLRLLCFTHSIYTTRFLDRINRSRLGNIVD